MNALPPHALLLDGRPLKPQGQGGVCTGELSLTAFMAHVLRAQLRAPSLKHQSVTAFRRAGESQERERSVKSTAACLAGEARALVYANVHTTLQSNLLAPLEADAFLVLSTRWSQIGTGKGAPHAVSEEAIAAALSYLQPVRHSISREDNATRFERMVDAYQPGCSSSEGRDVCMGQLAVALRWRECLGLVEEHESRVRQQPYSWFVRVRPDAHLVCRFDEHAVALLSQRLGTRPSHPSVANSSLPSATVRPQASLWVGYAWDLFAFMPRQVANVVLQQVPLAQHIKACRDYRARPEYCNPCVARRHDAKVYTIRGFPLDVARHCQMMEAEKRGKTCLGAAGPHPRNVQNATDSCRSIWLEPGFSKAAVVRSSACAPTSSGRAPLSALPRLLPADVQAYH